MGLGKKYSFYELINSYKIEIPQIQRDYVQYRSDEKVIKNRKSLVTDLVLSLKDNKSLSLSFVYGTIEGSKGSEVFIPVDGQQRLTTLFLLHYYAYASCKEFKKINTLAKAFSYKTRKSTERFLSCLAEKESSKAIGKIISSGEPLDTGIKNLSWYSSLWDSDPTICSCLVMLEEINIAFKSHNLDGKNVAMSLESSCPITFMFLEIKDLGKPNELYIKMNSRGKQLTDYEIFKADLLEYLESIKYANLEKLKKKLDGEWLELVWDLFLEKENVDPFYRELIHYVFLAREPIQNDNSHSYLDSYKDIIKIEDSVKDLEYFMDTLCSAYSSHSKLFNLIKKAIFEIKEDKKSVSYAISNFKERVLIFAVIYFSEKSSGVVNLDNLYNWLRIINNLALTPSIDTIDRYRGAVSAIKSFCDITDINSHIVANKALNIGFFTDYKREEEAIKMLLINQSTEWTNAISIAEENEYLASEIFFILKMVGINTVDDVSPYGVRKFSSYYDSFVRVIEKKELLRRALLTYCDISVMATRSFTDIYTYYYNDTKHHDYDYRGMLRNNNIAFDSFKELLDDFKASGLSFEDFAKGRIDNFHTTSWDFATSSKDILRHLLVKLDGMLEYMRHRNRVWHNSSDNTLRLMYSEMRSSSHVESSIYAVYLMIKKAFGDTGLYVNSLKGLTVGARDNYLSYKSLKIYRLPLGFEVNGNSLGTIPELIDYLDTLPSLNGIKAKVLYLL